MSQYSGGCQAIELGRHGKFDILSKQKEQRKTKTNNTHTHKQKKKHGVLILPHGHGHMALAMAMDVEKAMALPKPWSKARPCHGQSCAHPMAKGRIISLGRCYDVKWCNVMMFKIS